MSLVLKSQITLNYEYDEDDDTLYAWVGQSPSEAITYETDEGYLIRLDPETREFVGVTIFDYHAKQDEEISLEWDDERRILHRPDPS